MVKTTVRCTTRQRATPSGAPPASDPMGRDLVTVGEVGPTWQAFGLNMTTYKNQNLSSLPHQGILRLGANAGKRRSRIRPSVPGKGPWTKHRPTIQAGLVPKH